MEILKYAFVLKLSLRHISKAETLENLVNELCSNTINVETKPILRLLVELKSFQADTGTTLVFVSSLLRSSIFIETNINVTLYSV